MLYQKSEINKIVLIFSEKYLLIAKCHFIYGKILDIYIYIYLFIYFYFIDILSSSQYLFISSGVILRIWSKYSMFYTQKKYNKGYISNNCPLQNSIVISSYAPGSRSAKSINKGSCGKSSA